MWCRGFLEYEYHEKGDILRGDRASSSYEVMYIMGYTDAELFIILTMASSFFGIWVIVVLR